MANKRQSRWSEAQLRNLRDLEAHFPDGKIVLFPICKEWGQSIKWDARVYGHWSGVLPPTRESLLAIGVPETEVEDMLNKTEQALSALVRMYPAMVPELERRLKELEVAVPPALPKAAEESKPEAEHQWR